LITPDSIPQAGVGVFGRLKHGVTPQQALSEVASIHSALHQADGKERDVRPILRDLQGEFSWLAGRNLRATVWVLFAAVNMVLLIACSNIAGLLLGRSSSRIREMAMRAALGSSRGRLVRQCLTEGAVLGLAGGALGVMVTALGIRPFVTFWPGSLPRAAEVQVDWQVLLFALGVSLLSGVLFGLAPALRMPARNLEQTLRSGARTLAGHSRRLHGSFVVSEIALAVVLLVSAGILGRTLLRLSSLDPGVNVKNVLVTRIAFSASTLANPAKARVAWQDVLDRARSLPGVQAAALVDTFPMRNGFNVMGYWTNAAVPPEDKQPQALASTVTPDYLKVMGTPLLEGRFFDDRDRQGSPIVIVIDEVLARSAFGRGAAVGKRLWVPDLGKEPVQVVGVVGHVRHWGLAVDDQAAVRDHIYYAYAQLPDNLVGRWSELTSLAVRTGVEPLSLVSALRHEERGATGDQAIYQVRTMEQLASASLSLQHFLLLLFGVFAGLALLLACIGLYGVLAYLTSQRVPEIGVRMALGATPGDVIRMVLRQSLVMVFAGAGVGIIGALMAGRLLERFVAGVKSLEPWTFAAMVSLLVIAALTASFVPARRASRVDPLVALRHE
jgi:predicted permease